MKIYRSKKISSRRHCTKHWMSLFITEPGCSATKVLSIYDDRSIAIVIDRYEYWQGDPNVVLLDSLG